MRNFGFKKNFRILAIILFVIIIFLFFNTNKEGYTPIQNNNYSPLSNMGDIPEFTNANYIRDFAKYFTKFTANGSPQKSNDFTSFQAPTNNLPFVPSNNFAPANNSSLA